MAEMREVRAVKAVPVKPVHKFMVEQYQDSSHVVHHLEHGHKQEFAPGEHDEIGAHMMERGGMAAEPEEDDEVA